MGQPDRFDLDVLVRNGPSALQNAAKTIHAEGATVDIADVQFLPPLLRPQKIICLGLNYKDHADEVAYEAPDFPVLFARFSSSLVGHDAKIIKPRLSDQLDFEGEMVAVIGKAGRDIAHGQALDHVIGYSIFNDASVRDYQLRTSQWTAGKNFDATGAFGPWLVPSEFLPAGGSGLSIKTRLNGDVVQHACTSDMIFDVASTVALLSSMMTLEPGDVLLMGTPAGVGLARTPPLYMKPGDICEVEIETLGCLVNAIGEER